MGKNTDLIGTPIGKTGKTLFLGNARLCDLEKKLDAPFGEILERVASSIDIRTIRACVQAGLARNHADDANDATVTALFDEVGIAELASAVVREFNFATGPASARAKAA